MLCGFVTKKLFTEGKQRMGIRNHMIGIVSSKEGRECLVSGRYQDIAEPTRMIAANLVTDTWLHSMVESSGRVRQAEEHTSATATPTKVYISYKAYLHW